MTASQSKIPLLCLAYSIPVREPTGTGYPQQENIQIHIFLLSKIYSFDPLSSCAHKRLTQDTLITSTSIHAPFLSLYHHSAPDSLGEITLPSSPLTPVHFLHSKKKKTTNPKTNL